MPEGDASVQDASFLKDDIERMIFTRYKGLSTYKVIGALEVVKMNLLDKLKASQSGAE